MPLNSFKRNKIIRSPQFGIDNKEEIFSIIDDSYICHVAFQINNQVYSIPTIHARKDYQLYLHGASKSRLISHIESGASICVSITEVDGLVMARSAFHHAMNYRSVVLFGKGRKTVGNEKLAALGIISDKLYPGRWEDVREPNTKELKATSVVVIEIEELSAKIRTGPPKDEKEDYSLPVWAGVIPLKRHFEAPEKDPVQDKNIPYPEYLENKFKNI